MLMTTLLFPDVNRKNLDSPTKLLPLEMMMLTLKLKPSAITVASLMARTDTLTESLSALCRLMSRLDAPLTEEIASTS